MAGNVYVDGAPIATPGHRVPENAQIHVKGLEIKYVSKGGLKLEWALSSFGIDVSGRTALDAGASTGGFTDCLLQHGAAKVYAVDVGYGQLAGKLRADERVVNMERTNISDLRPEDLAPRPSIATIDLSNLSLKVSIPIIGALIEHPGDMFCLVKPLFEVPDPQIRRTGSIDDPAIYVSVLCDLAAYVDSIGLKSRGVTHSPVTGNRGTREFFLWASRGGPVERGDIHAQVNAAVDAALRLPLYKRPRFTVSSKTKL